MTDRRAGRELVQATCVALDGLGLLLRGRPGIGKSDLALRLVDEGARLVSDDLVQIAAQDGRLMARLPDGAAPETRGRIEVRGLGILPVPSVEEIALALVVELKPQGEIERLPEPKRWSCLGIELPVVEIDPRAASATAKLRLVARSAPAGIMPPP
jgi:serine kinase of HPr protein (carbohydrate metabolism regulator)